MENPRQDGRRREEELACERNNNKQGVSSDDNKGRLDSRNNQEIAYRYRGKYDVLSLTAPRIGVMLQPLDGRSWVKVEFEARYCCRQWRGKPLR